MTTISRSGGEPKATTGERAPLAPDAITGLRTRVRGAVHLPGEPGYDEARSIWNAMIDRRPALVVRALGTADVIQTVLFAREHGLALSIKGGGHNIAGLAVADGALLLDLSLMRGVWVDPGRRVARAQAGCLLGDVDRETQLHGLAATLGFVSATGIAGLTLGGGFGYLSRRFGWTTDTLAAVELVTAEGKLVRASARENPDLFWGLRGGGGNFGVATSFEYELRSVGPEIVGGAIAWHASDAGDVLEFFREFAERAPHELTCVAALRMAPPAPWLPKDVHGKPIMLSVVCHTGPVAQAERDLAPLKAFGKPVGDVVQRRPYVQQQALLDATQPKGRRYYWKSEYIAALTPEVLRTYLESAFPIPSPHSAAILFQLGGAIADRPADDSPVGNRDARWVVNITGSWERPEDDKTNVAWARGMWERMRRFSTGGVYVNFLTEEEGRDRIEAAYGQQNLARLAAVKATWDPENFFRVNKNVKPA